MKLLLSFALSVFASTLCAQPPSTTLPNRINVVVNGHHLPANSYGLFVQEVTSGTILLDVNGSENFNPASTMKVLTTLAALERLGPAFTWNTKVYATGPVVDDTLQGDLLIQGGGDPFLLEEHLRNLLKALQREGIKHIQGNLVLDSSYFADEVSQEPLIDDQVDRAYNVLPHALMSNFQTVTFFFAPHANNHDVVIKTDPQLPNLIVRNALRLQEGACAGYQRGIRIDDDPANANTVVVSGSFPNQCQEFSLVRSVLTPTEYFFGLFTQLWRELGGTFTGSLQSGVALAERPLLSWQSPPLGDVIKSINKFSNNMMTRQTLLTLGAEQNAAPATVEGGGNAISEYLSMLGIDSTGLVVSNGAGLAREARISPALLNHVLQHGYASAYMPEFVSSLPLNGVDGTMRNRLRSANMKGRMHIKTGSLDQVAAVAGYVYASSGKIYSVVGVLNHPQADQGPGVELMDALLTWVYEQ